MNYFKKIFKVVVLFFLGIIAYFSYLLIAYHRISDYQTLQIDKPDSTINSVMKVNTIYSAITYNIGFGAYLPDFSFFMDGGTSSWAKSKESVIETINHIALFLKQFNPDLIALQEVDINGTRSYHVDENEIIYKVLNNYYHTFAVNYDSPFLFYPFLKPHGKNKSGLASYSKFEMTNALRRSLPISHSFKRFLDLDRAYSIIRIPVDNGKELIFINVHLSAYGTDDSVRYKQLTQLINDMEKEYQSGNYVLVAGDYNHELKINKEFSEHSWAQPFPREMLPEHFHLSIDLLSTDQQDALWDSARDSEKAYVLGETPTFMLDGFIFSDNIEIVLMDILKTGYAYSDHEPVSISFLLK